MAVCVSGYPDVGPLVMPKTTAERMVAFEVTLEGLVRDNARTAKNIEDKMDKVIVHLEHLEERQSKSESEVAGYKNKGAGVLIGMGTLITILGVTFSGLLDAIRGTSQ